MDRDGMSEIFNPTKRKVFISYHHHDKLSAQQFVDQFGRQPNQVFLPKALGLRYDEDDVVRNVNVEYVINTRGQEYIGDSTIQIVLIGTCTHSRRFIDWEIQRSLLRGNGLIGIVLPNVIEPYLPDRLSANCAPAASPSVAAYARVYSYPSNGGVLRRWIEDAFEARTSREHLKVDTGVAWLANQECRVCQLTH